MDKPTTAWASAHRAAVIALATAALASCGRGDNPDEGKVQFAARPALATAPAPQTQPAAAPRATTAPATTAASAGEPVTLPDGLIIEDHYCPVNDSRDIGCESVE